ncbi:MAG TPA: BrnT family toxin [Caulobacteraceae bacterium]
MIFEWNPAKARSNLDKHGVAFEDAERVWRDPLHIIYFDRVEAGEARWWAVGVVGGLTTLLVVHMYPDPDDDERVRIIGARRATPRERRRYEEDNANFRATLEA